MLKMGRLDLRVRKLLSLDVGGELFGWTFGGILRLAHLRSRGGSRLSSAVGSLASHVLLDFLTARLGVLLLLILLPRRT